MVGVDVVRTEAVVENVAFKKEWLRSFQKGERRYVEIEFSNNNEMHKQMTLASTDGYEFKGVMFCAVAAVEDGYQSRLLLCVERVK